MRYLALIIATVLLVGNVDARRSSSSSSSFRSSSSRSSSTPSKSTTTKKVTPTRTTDKSSTIKSTATTTTKPKATSTNKLDTKLQKKKLASKDKAAFTKYSSKKEATADYQKNLASKNSYTSASAPTTRPKEVPERISYNGRDIPVSYNAYPGGGYGYGYIDPLTMAFIALQPRYYVVDPYAMRSAGYGQWDASGQPVRTSSGAGVILLSIIIGAVIIVVIVFTLSR